MTDYRGRDDRGTVLIITVVTMTLLAFGVLMLAGTVKRLLDASLAEALAAEQRLASKTATGVLDAWMADQEDSDAILNNDAGRMWMTPVGEQPCPDPSATPPRDICWSVSAVTYVTFTDPDLRGGEARRVATDVTFEVAAGCYTDAHEDCQRTTSTTRRYERAVLFQYQLHYDTNLLPEEALEGPDGAVDPADCLTPTPADPALCDRPHLVLDGPDGVRDPADCLTPTPTNLALCDGPRIIVFARGDTLTGPVRTTLTKVLYCNDPTFSRVEVSGSLPDPPINPLVPADPNCPANPMWQGITTPPTPSLQDLLDSERIVFGGDLDLPALDASGYSATLRCDVVDFDTYDVIAADCFAPGDPVNPVAITGNSTISPSPGSDITIHELVLNGSATVYAEGDIIICGDIEARGTNPAGGPNVIALVTKGDVILDPSGQPSLCGNDLITPMTELSGRPAFWQTTPPPPCEGDGVDNHDLILCNVAVLAPEGAIYARNWHLHHHPSGGPTLTIEGSIAAKHLGLYGIPDPATGDIAAGWAKNFTYPTDFWQARPPWWPGYDGHEWA